MGLTKDEFLGLKVGDKVIRSKLGTMDPSDYTIRKEYKILEISPSWMMEKREYKVKRDNGESGFVWFDFADNWELPKVKGDGMTQDQWSNLKAGDYVKRLSQGGMPDKRIHAGGIYKIVRRDSSNDPEIIGDDGMRHWIYNGHYLKMWEVVESTLDQYPETKSIIVSQFVQLPKFSLTLES